MQVNQEFSFCLSFISRSKKTLNKVAKAVLYDSLYSRHTNRFRQTYPLGE